MAENSTISSNILLQEHRGRAFDAKYKIGAIELAYAGTLIY